ncbi:MAG: hypothetical protein E7177_03550 [Erysipelotrichaceae bacterium]|nr:hypothetical protein [Erysipelotrichaceae bacterium]
MKIIEERYLKREIRKLNKYSRENRVFLDFFFNIDLVMDKTLQDLSFKSDIDFFNEISFILNVIVSIISRPHLLSTGEEIVVRSEQASYVSHDMFQKTLRDSLLWKEKQGLDMIPEHVYYYQQIDELKIYENIFIVMLIKKIEQEIKKYSDFYVSTILTFNNQDSLSVNRDNSDLALQKMRVLINKIKHIKNTYFFKEINSKVNTNLGIIHPTNILLKDRLYNYCFKFYRKMVTYTDKYSRLKDIRSFYYVQFIKVIKEMGFIPINGENIRLKGVRKFVIPKVSFESNDFILTIHQIDKYFGLILDVENKGVRTKKLKKSKHLLLFDSKQDISTVVVDVDIEDYDTVEILNLWNLGLVHQDIKTLYSNPVPEKEMMKEWVESKIRKVVGSKKIYSVYCPSCKSLNIEINKDGKYICGHCKSKYTFYKGTNGDTIWFNRLRRKF